jgi:hypothetical protein
MRLVLDNPKQWTPRRLLINSRTNLGWPPDFGQISNWASHVSGLGPSFMKIWTCRSSPWSGSQNAWTRIKNVNCACRQSKFWIFFGAIQMIPCGARLVTMDETWLYHYEPEIKQQSLVWLHSVSPEPKKFRVWKTAEKVLASNFFGIKTASSPLIIIQRAKLTTQSITHLC